MPQPSALIKAIAWEAFKQDLTPERLGRFTDDEWSELVKLAEAEGATAEDCVVAVEYLRVLIDARDNIRTKKQPTFGGGL